MQIGEFYAAKRHGCLVEKYMRGRGKLTQREHFGLHPMEGPFSATSVSKDGLCSVDSTISMSGSDLR